MLEPAFHGLSKEEIAGASPIDLTDEQRAERKAILAAQEKRERDAVWDNGKYSLQAAIAHAQKWGLVRGFSRQP